MNKFEIVKGVNSLYQPTASPKFVVKKLANEFLMIYKSFELFTSLINASSTEIIPPKICKPIEVMISYNLNMIL